MWVHKTRTINAWENFFIYKEMLYMKYYVYGIIIYKYIRLLIGSQERNMDTKMKRYLSS